MNKYVVQVGKKKYRSNSYKQMMSIVDDCNRKKWTCYFYDFETRRYDVYKEGRMLRAMVMKFI